MATLGDVQSTEHRGLHLSIVDDEKQAKTGTSVETGTGSSALSLITLASEDVHLTMFPRQSLQAHSLRPHTLAANQALSTACESLF